MTKLSERIECCVCGAMVDTREIGAPNDATPKACELVNGDWVCSEECWNAVFPDIENQRLAFEQEQYQEEQRYLEAQEMQRHFMEHPHG